MTVLPGDIAEAGRMLRSGELTALGLLEAVTEKADSWDGELEVFARRTSEAAYAAARRADDELAHGVDRGPLHGIPLGIKDMLLTECAPTRANSAVFAADDARLRRDGAAVRRLLDGGAVPVGKTTTMELCAIYPDVHDPDHVGAVPRNPWDTERWAGGSSSGTASGLATGMFLAGVGTDTGGSVRLPAAYCGVTGLKPTYGRIPTDGLLPLAPGLDHIGPLARSAADCAVLLQVMAGQPSSTDSPISDWPGALTALDGAGVAGLRIGLEREYHLDAPGTHPAVRDVTLATAEALAGLGAEIVTVSLPHWPAVDDAAALLSSVGAHLTHRRGLARDRTAYSRRARAVLGAGAYPTGADVTRAHQVVASARAGLDDLFGRVDVLLLPTTVRPADRLTDLTDRDGLDRGHYVRAWNALGNPAVSVPAGCDSNGLPVGVQFIAARHDELSVLRVAVAHQSATAFHTRSPAMGHATRWPPDEGPGRSRVLPESR